MPSSPLFKFMDQTRATNGEPIWWNRADRDGAPFRGQAPPIATEEELEERLQKVADPQNRMFDLSDPQQNADYLAVMDKIVNNWAKLMHREHFKIPVKRIKTDPESGLKTVSRDVQIKVYVEWVEIYMQDGQPLLAQRPYVGRPNSD